jgi:hypothetical protein
MQHVSDHIQIIWSFVVLRGCASRSFASRPSRHDRSWFSSTWTGPAFAIQTVPNDCRLDKVYDGRTVFPVMICKSTEIHRPSQDTISVPADLAAPTPNHHTKHPTHLA